MTKKQIEVINECIDELSMIIGDEDLTCEKLEDYSEGVLPNIHSMLVKLVWKYNHPEKELINE